MNSPNMVKVIAAFVGGIIVALGSALIYVKVNHGSAQQQAMVQTAPPLSGVAALPDTDHGGTTQAAAQAPPPVQKSAPKHHHRQSEQTAGATATDKEQPPVLVAQNTAPPAANPPANPYGSAPPPPNPAPAQAPVAVAPAPPPVPVRQPRTVTIPAGTTLSVRLGEKLSTNDNSTGDAFRGTLEAPLIVNGAVIAERGSKVLGKVVNAEKAGKVKGVSDLQLALTEINTSDGQRVEIRTAALDKQGPTGKKKDAAKVGGGAALGAIIGAIAGGGKGAGIGAGVGGAAGAGDVLLTRGKPVVLPVETKLSFQLSAPVRITERLNSAN